MFRYHFTILASACHYVLDPVPRMSLRSDSVLRYLVARHRVSVSLDTALRYHCHLAADSLKSRLCTGPIVFGVLHAPLSGRYHVHGIP